MNFAFIKNKSSTFFHGALNLLGKNNTRNPYSSLWSFQKMLDKKPRKKSGFVYKQELLIRQGEEQFKMLVKKGLGIPVVLL